MNENNINIIIDSWSIDTKKTYISIIKKFEGFIKKPLLQATIKDLNDYFIYLNNLNYKNNTIKLHRFCLQSLYNLFFDNKIINFNPVKKLEKILNKNNKNFIKKKDMIDQKIINNYDVKKVIKIATKKTSIIIEFLAGTGLRISEMINIKYIDIINQGKLTKIKIKGRGAIYRYINVPTEIIDRIKNIYFGNEYLFTSKNGNKLNRTCIYIQIRRAFSKAKVEGVHPHTMRHYYVTEMLNNKFPLKAISKQIGHSNILTTLYYYDHTKLKEKDQFKKLV